jgi:protein phosphatase
VHGCLDELCTLLAELGWAPDAAAATLDDSSGRPPVAPWRHPEGRTLVLVGDLVDRGPRIVETLRLAMAMHAAGTALTVPGNHDDKLLRRLRGHAVHVSHGLEATLAELDVLPVAFAERVRAFLAGLPSHLVLAGGQLVVAHAGLPRALHGREGRRVRDHALFGETTGVSSTDGLPLRVDWAARYHGRSLVVYGHTPVTEPRWRNETVDIDTGCVFGGALTALRWPERTLVQVPAARQYAVPGRAMRADPFVDPLTLRLSERRAHDSDRRAQRNG